MKNKIRLLGSVFAALAAHVSLAQSPSPLPSASPSIAPYPCQISSWTPEQHSYYGARDTITEGLKALKINNLRSHRIFLFIVQHRDTVEVRFYERGEGGSYTVRTFQRNNGTAAMAQIDKAILNNEGKGCVGERCKSVFDPEIANAQAKPATVTDSVPQTFAEIVNDQKLPEFFKVTLVILC
jgi:hypothetical protein